MKKIIQQLISCCFSIICMMGTALAIPISADISTFSGSATVINYNSIGNETPISNQYSANGVNFTGALYGMANPGDTKLFYRGTNGYGIIASNWLYTQEANGGLSFEADFTSPVNKVGFYLENSPLQSATVEIYSGLIDLGSIVFSTSNLFGEFKGLQSLYSFDHLVFSNTDSYNGFFAINDFRFEASSNIAFPGNNAIPEPSTVILLSAGLVGVGLLRRLIKM